MVVGLLLYLREYKLHCFCGGNVVIVGIYRLGTIIEARMRNFLYILLSFLVFTEYSNSQNKRDDYSPVPKQYFSIDKKNNISMELISKNYEIVDSLGVETLKYINTDYCNGYYSINNDGLILKKNIIYHDKE